MLKQIPTIKTKITIPDLIKSLVKAWQKSHNALPRKEQIITIIAQFCHESGEGKSCYAYNLCNVKAKDDPNAVIKYVILTGVWEIINGVKVQVPTTSPSAHFRGFETLDEGVEFYLQFLQGKRYKTAWAAVEAGDPKQFVHLLKIAGYYTDLEDRYLKGVMAYYNKYMKDQTFEKVINELNQPKLIVDQNNNITVSGNLNPPSTSFVSKVGGIFSGFFKK